MNMKPYPLRVPKGLLELAEIKSKEERTDKTTALRQWLYAGAEEYVIDLLSAGRLTLSQAAELLELSAYDLDRLAKQQSVEIGATSEQYRKSKKTARELFKKL
jgi:predicted HTH domain antitoxin